MSLNFWHSQLSKEHPTIRWEKDDSSQSLLHLTMACYAPSTITSKKKTYIQVQMDKAPELITLCILQCDKCDQKSLDLFFDTSVTFTLSGEDQIPVQLTGQSATSSSSSSSSSSTTSTNSQALSSNTQLDAIGNDSSDSGEEYQPGLDTGFGDSSDSSDDEEMEMEKEKEDSSDSSDDDDDEKKKKKKKEKKEEDSNNSSGNERDTDAERRKALLANGKRKAPSSETTPAQKNQSKKQKTVKKSSESDSSSDSESDSSDDNAEGEVPAIKPTAKKDGAQTPLKKLSAIVPRNGIKAGDLGTAYSTQYKESFKEVANSKLTAFIKKHLEVFNLSTDGIITLKKK